jgi:hypothetical protein
MAHRKAFEQSESKIGNSETKHQVMWPIVRSLIKRYGPKALTTTHGNLVLKFHPLETGKSTADCLKNQFTPMTCATKTMSGW